jgi:hypothetical protein
MSVFLGRQKVGPHFFYKLYCFHFVVRLGSYSRAAQHLNVTQPTISRAVQSLEFRFKKRLLNRKTRSKISLSFEGSRVFAWSTQLLNILEGLEQHQEPSVIGVPLRDPTTKNNLNTKISDLFKELSLCFKDAGSAGSDP